MGKPSATHRSLKLPDCVLVVEDDALLAMSIEQILHDAGVPDVTTCATTGEAVAFLRNKRPDALVLDVHLADRDDGYSIAEVVAVLKPQQPKIAFSTATPQDIPPSIAKMGIVLEKPYRPEALLDAISRKPRGLMSLMRAKA